MRMTERCRAATWAAAAGADHGAHARLLALLCNNLVAEDDAGRGRGQQVLEVEVLSSIVQLVAALHVLRVDDGELLVR